jgi:hypothetical protein
MMDGVWLDKELCAIVAVGIDTQGAKQVLDFEVGTSESAECAARLLRRLVERGFGPVAGHRLLGVIDGAAALRKALVGQWPNILLQECLVHVERHLLDRLRRGDRDEAQGLMQRLRVAQGAQAAEEAFEELSRFLGQRHEGAQASLLEAKGRLLTVHGLGLGETLQRSLLSTNAIENVLRNCLRPRLTGPSPCGQPAAGHLAPLGSLSSHTPSIMSTAHDWAFKSRPRNCARCSRPFCAQASAMRLLPSAPSHARASPRVLIPSATSRWIIASWLPTSRTIAQLSSATSRRPSAVRTRGRRRLSRRPS